MLKDIIVSLDFYFAKIYEIIRDFRESAENKNIKGFEIGFVNNNLLNLILRC